MQNEVAELMSENRGLKMALSIHGLQVPDDCTSQHKQTVEERTSESTFVSHPEPSERRPSVLQQQVIVSSTTPTTVSVINRSATVVSSNNHSDTVTTSTV